MNLYKCIKYKRMQHLLQLWWKKKTQECLRTGISSYTECPVINPIKLHHSFSTNTESFFFFLESVLRFKYFRKSQASMPHAFFLSIPLNVLFSSPKSSLGPVRLRTVVWVREGAHGKVLMFYSFLAEHDLQHCSL